VCSSVGASSGDVQAIAHGAGRQNLGGRGVEEVDAEWFGSAAAVADRLGAGFGQELGAP